MGQCARENSIVVYVKKLFWAVKNMFKKDTKNFKFQSEFTACTP